MGKVLRRKLRLVLELRNSSARNVLNERPEEIVWPGQLEV